MRKNRSVAIILILSFILSFLPQSEVRAVDTDTMAETEYQEEKEETDSSSGTDEIWDSEKPNETESVIQQDSGISEPDVQDDAIETENDTSEEYQEERGSASEIPLSGSEETGSSAQSYAEKPGHDADPPVLF